jgi:lysophospholipase L1-like esterase
MKLLCCSLLVAAVAAISAATAAAAPAPHPYLALGDSVAFGYSPLLDHTNASNFIGYPNIAAMSLKQDLTNASCPGETSSHFISVSASDNGCGPYRAFFPLHVDYGSAANSQLAFTDSFLQANPDTATVSIDIGANDLFVLVRVCGGNPLCVVAGMPGLLATLSANLDTIYGHIRTLDGYHHKLVGLTYYSLNYADPVGTSLISQVNQVIAARTIAWRGVVGDGFGAFQGASTNFGGDTCAAGLRIVLTTSPLACDVHPTPAGRDLLAQAIVNALRPD